MVPFKDFEDDNMVANDGLLRIFWPNDLPSTATAGVMVGWRNSEFDFFVVTVLPDIEVNTLVWLIGLRLVSKCLVGPKCRECISEWYALPEH